MKKEYKIKQLDSKKIFLFYTSTEDFKDFYKSLQKRLKKENFNGFVYVDQLSIVHSNGMNRFFRIAFENNSFNFSKVKHIKGNNEFKKITSDFFNKNKNYLDNTILYESEKKKILNNEII